MTSNLLFAVNALLAEAAASSPLQFRIDTLIFSLLIFVILVVLLAQYAWNPIMDGLEKREKSIANNIDEARAANEKAQATLAQYEQKIASGGSRKRRRMIAEAKVDAERARKRIMEEAGAEAQRQRERTIAEINAARDAAVRELAERSVDSAVVPGRFPAGQGTPVGRSRPD